MAAELPDLILLDIKMPGMDGYEVCRQLKANENYRDIPVIFISALNDTADKLKGFGAGGIDYITKPFEPAEVLARVQTHVRLRQLQLQMEALVRQRTEDLSRTNDDLMMEIAEHARAEQELLRANRSLTMLSACNQALIHARDETYLLSEICRIIEKNRPRSYRRTTDGAGVQFHRSRYQRTQKDGTSPAGFGNPLSHHL